jgi:hypothetical protein
MCTALPRDTESYFSSLRERLGRTDVLAGVFFVCVCFGVVLNTRMTHSLCVGAGSYPAVKGVNDGVGLFVPVAGCGISINKSVAQHMTTILDRTTYGN